MNIYMLASILIPPIRINNAKVDYCLNFIIAVHKSLVYFNKSYILREVGN